MGRKVGRTIYLNDKLVGVMDTPELAQRMVDGQAERALREQVEARLDWLVISRSRRLEAAADG